MSTKLLPFLEHEPEEPRLLKIWRTSPGLVSIFICPVFLVASDSSSWLKRTEPDEFFVGVAYLPPASVCCYAFLFHVAVTSDDL